MIYIYFIVHPEIVPDPLLPINLWAYSEYGLARQIKLIKTSWLRSFDIVYCGPEERVRDTATSIVNELGYHLHVRDDLSEIKRSAPGMPMTILKPEEFAKCMEDFYAHPEGNSCGWEKAADAQARIVAAVNEIAQQSPDNWHAAIISYEELARLLLAYYTKKPVTEIEKTIKVGIGLEFDDLGVFSSWRQLELE